MIKKIVILVVITVISMLLAAVSRIELKSKVIYTDKSFDRHGNIYFWAKTESSNALKRVDCGVDVGDTITVYEGTAYTAILLFVAAASFIYLVCLIFLDE